MLIEIYCAEMRGLKVIRTFAAMAATKSLELAYLLAQSYNDTPKPMANEYQLYALIRIIPNTGTQCN